MRQSRPVVAPSLSTIPLSQPSILPRPAPVSINPVAGPYPLSASVLSIAQSAQSATLSRTTLWRRRKQCATFGASSSQEGREPAKRKTYSCKVCQLPVTSEGHTQFKGKRCCPHEPGVLPVKELLELRRAEAATRAIEEDKDKQ